jgi:uncharacterized protein (DUF885 family)
MSVFAAITRLVHHYDFPPIEFVCNVLTGTSGADDVTHSYSDASWKVRNKAYDDMSPDETRAAARVARQTIQLQALDDVTCAAMAVIAAQDSRAYDSVQNKLQVAAETARKRNFEVLQGGEPNQDREPNQDTSKPDILNEYNLIPHAEQDIQNARTVMMTFWRTSVFSSSSPEWFACCK